MLMKPCNEQMSINRPLVKGRWDAGLAFTHVGCPPGGQYTKTGPGNRRSAGPCSMAKMADAGKDHCNVAVVGRLNHLAVAD
jgi:hypothetical protein